MWEEQICPFEPTRMLFFFLRERWRVSSGAWLRLWNALGGFLLIKKRDSSVLISALVFLFIAEVAWNFGLLRCIIGRQILFLNLPREWATITESARGSVIVRESSFSVRHLLGWIAHMTLFSTSPAQCHFFFFYLGHNKGVIYRGSEWISGRQEHDLTAGVDSKTTSHFVKLPLCQIVLTLFSIFPDFFFFFRNGHPLPPLTLQKECTSSSTRGFVRRSYCTKKKQKKTSTLDLDFCSV